MLSEMPRRWGQAVSRWLRANRSRRTEVDGDIVPDRNVEYLFYQTLVGAWPPDLAPDDADAVAALAGRVGAYMIKAVREGKEDSGWSNPNTAYEAALQRFVAGVLDASRPNAFLADFHGFIAPMLRPAAIASLAQLAVKLTAPGVPDIYQGGELWDFSLVDPDNRRAPDWRLRRTLVAAVAAARPGTLADGWQDGREKQFLAARLLHLRRRHPALFAAGDYAPLHGEGGRGDDHLFAFMRQYEETALITAVPRLVWHLYGGGDSPEWGATRLKLPQPGCWRDALSGRLFADGDSIAASELFSEFPVSVLLENI
jgi:(1->4)-alpha-D-glucan 1-alpha-D-glucosylmutase